MHIALIILIVIASIIALMLIVALFLKKEYTIEREIVINKPKPLVFHYLKNIKNQDYFSKWVMTDPNMKKDFKGTDGTVGFVYAWDSTNKQAGAGEQEIISIDEGNKIDIEVRFIRPFAGTAYTPFYTEALSPDQTKVIWGIKNKMKYPMNLMVALMNMEKMLGNDVEISLKNLKDILEK
jgi:hypothetical protein